LRIMYDDVCDIGGEWWSLYYVVYMMYYILYRIWYIMDLCIMGYVWVYSVVCVMYVTGCSM